MHIFIGPKEADPCGLLFLTQQNVSMESQSFYFPVKNTFPALETICEGSLNPFKGNAFKKKIPMMQIFAHSGRIAFIKQVAEDISMLVRLPDHDYSTQSLSDGEKWTPPFQLQTPPMFFCSELK